MIGQKVYSLKKKKDSEELHLFRGEVTDPRKCRVENNSICGQMQKSESEETLFECKHENPTRIKCAEIGRQVCGVCVSHLYATY